MSAIKSISSVGSTLSPVAGQDTMQSVSRPSSADMSSYMDEFKTQRSVLVDAPRMSGVQTTSNPFMQFVAQADARNKMLTDNLSAVERTQDNKSILNAVVLKEEASLQNKLAVSTLDKTVKAINQLTQLS